MSSLRNCIAQGDAEEILQELPAESVDLIFTSPPYYNARPEYVDYIGYEEYLLKIRKVLHHAHRVLAEGRFLRDEYLTSLDSPRQPQPGIEADCCAFRHAPTIY
jgi:hypothetical protein